MSEQNATPPPRKDYLVRRRIESFIPLTALVLSTLFVSGAIKTITDTDLAAAVFSPARGIIQAALRSGIPMTEVPLRATDSDLVVRGSTTYRDFRSQGTSPILEILDTSWDLGQMFTKDFVAVSPSGKFVIFDGYEYDKENREYIVETIMIKRPERPFYHMENKWMGQYQRDSSPHLHVFRPSFERETLVSAWINKPVDKPGSSQLKIIEQVPFDTNLLRFGETNIPLNLNAIPNPKLAEMAITPEGVGAVELHSGRESYVAAFDLTTKKGSIIKTAHDVDMSVLGQSGDAIVLMQTTTTYAKTGDQSISRQIGILKMDKAGVPSFFSMNEYKGKIKDLGINNDGLFSADKVIASHEDFTRAYNSTNGPQE
ncbi:MAG: hypothetical protein Q7S61_04070 [bacterium]|nr:hypothetical protein [bacterium]